MLRPRTTPRVNRSAVRALPVANLGANQLEVRFSDLMAEARSGAKPPVSVDTRVDAVARKPGFAEVLSLGNQPGNCGVETQFRGCRLGRFGPSLFESTLEMDAPQSAPEPALEAVEYGDSVT